MGEHGEEGGGREGGGLGEHGVDHNRKQKKRKLEQSLAILMAVKSLKERYNVAVQVYANSKIQEINFWKKGTLPTQRSAAPDAHSVKPQEVAVLKRRIVGLKP